MAWSAHNSGHSGYLSKEVGLPSHQGYSSPPQFNNPYYTMSSKNPSEAGMVLFIGISPADHNLVNLHSNLHQDGYTLDSPMYSARIDLSKKPNVTVARGSMRPENIIAAADFHKFSGKVDLTVRSQPVQMKASTMGTKHTVDIPGLGECKWKPLLANSSPELTDTTGKSLAKMSGAVSDYVWNGADNRLEISMGWAEATLDVIVISAIVLWVNMKITTEITKKSTAFGIGAAVG